MFVVNSDNSIYLTRGDTAYLNVNAYDSNNIPYAFHVGDVVRFKVVQKNRCDLILVCKDIVIESETTTATIPLTKDDTKIGELIHKPKDYWYEVELNPDTAPQTIIGYDANGPKVLRLFPEGDDPNE